MDKRYRLPAEWEEQSAVMLTWPHEATDWAAMMPEVEAVYKRMAVEIARRECLIVVTTEPQRVGRILDSLGVAAKVLECQTNDTWARDHGPITLLSDDGRLQLLDFQFNGWGMKFAADKDNFINRRIKNSLQGDYQPHLDFVLEGGSIESDGQGTIMTTAACLLSGNRNDTLSREQIEDELKRRLCASRVLWVEGGHLEGDDTDSHIDTLARLCPGDVIAYVRCDDTTDPHYADLSAMEASLRSFRTAGGLPYRLVALPMPKAILCEGERLPATYANFLIMNGAVLVPTYGQESDEVALSALQSVFPGREMVGIDCRPLIRQHGSLHCCTMQFPAARCGD